MISSRLEQNNRCRSTTALMFELLDATFDTPQDKFDLLFQTEAFYLEIIYFLKQLRNTVLRLLSSPNTVLPKETDFHLQRDDG